MLTDSNGDYERLTPVQSVEKVKLQPASWFADDKHVWIHTKDSRDLSKAPDSVKIFLNSGFPQVQGDIKGYIENIQFEGGHLAAFTSYNKVGSDNQILYFKDSSFKYSSGGNGYRGLGTKRVIMDSVVAAKNHMDGLNYHIREGVKPEVIEINMISRHNGFTDKNPNNNNASTIHDGGTILRINGEYTTSGGINIADIDEGTQSLNLGIKAYSSRNVSEGGSINIFAGNNVDAMWLFNTSTYGSKWDIKAQGRSTVHVHHPVVIDKERVSSTNEATVVYH